MPKNQHFNLKLGKYFTFFVGRIDIMPYFASSNKQNKKEMNTEFNTIEKIRTNASITNKSAAYLAACDEFEIQASNFANNENFVSRKSAEEVSLAYAKAKKADCEYAIYSAAHACENWLSKAWNNAD